MPLLTASVISFRKPSTLNNHFYRKVDAVIHFFMLESEALQNGANNTKISFNITIKILQCVSIEDALVSFIHWPLKRLHITKSWRIRDIL